MLKQQIHQKNLHLQMIVISQLSVKLNKERLKSIMKETLAEGDLIVNEDKAEETIINQLKDESDEEWRKTKKLGSLGKKIEVYTTILSSI